MTRRSAGPYTRKELIQMEFPPRVFEDPADDGPEVKVIQNFYVFPEGWRGLYSYTQEERMRACRFKS